MIAGFLLWIRTSTNLIEGRPWQSSEDRANHVRSPAIFDQVPDKEIAICTMPVVLMINPQVSWLDGPLQKKLCTYRIDLLY
jgi:hypothetical protein